MTGHVRQRSPGSWEIRYSLGTDPATGNRKIATATVRGSRKDADKELRRLLRSLDTNAPPKSREEEAAKAKARAAERFGV